MVEGTYRCAQVYTLCSLAAAASEAIFLKAALGKGAHIFLQCRAA